MSVTIDPDHGNLGLEPTTSNNAVAPPDPRPVPDGSTNGPATSEPDAPSSTPPRRRRWPYVAAGLGVAAAGTAGVIALGDDAGDEPVDTTSERRVVSAAVTDLVEFTDLDGRMVYADTTTLTAASDGVITDVIAEGEIVERGTQLYEVNGAPVSAFVGDTPMYRTLADGATGDDVEMVEANLASLGHHTFEDDDGDPVDTGFLVDGVWDDATTEAVVRWQEDIGVDATGELAANDIVVIGGAALVTDVPVEVGDRVATNSPLVELNTESTVSTRHVEHSGDVELLVGSGDVIGNGDVIYTVDDAPVTAIVADEPLERELRDGVDDGDDVLVLEEMLIGLGYDADGDLDVDDEFDEFTAQAVTEWQEDLQNIDEDLRADGRVDPADLYLIEADESVGTVTMDDGELASGTELWVTEAAAITRVVETAIDVVDQDRLAVGDIVDVEFPDGELASGTVTEIASSSTVDPLTPDAEPTLAVEIALDAIPASAAELNELDVEIKLVDELSLDATVVPVSALIARGDGTFAVEAVTTTGTTFVTVEPGMFSDGSVAVTGIQPGTQVVVP